MIECGSTYSKDTYLKSLQKLESFIDAFWRKLNSIKFFFFVWIKSMDIRKKKIPLSHSVDGKISIAFNIKSNSTKIQIAHMFIINFSLMRKERLRFIVFIIDENDTPDYTQIAPLRVVSFRCSSIFFSFKHQWNRDKSNIW